MAKNNLAQIIESWTPAVKKITNNAVNESTPGKLAWMCEYAHNHVMALNEDANSAVGGVSFPYQTLNNTVGVGNAVPASFGAQTAADQQNINSFGSGDKWPSLLPMALQVAARTIGFDLVNTVPFQGPTGVLPFLDYVYSGSKDVYGATPAYNEETANPEKITANDGTGTTIDAWKRYGLPHAFRTKLVVATGDKKADVIEAIKDACDVSATPYITIGNTNKLKVQFIGLSRLNAQPMFRVIPGQGTATSLGMVFEEDAAGVPTATATVGTHTVTLTYPRLISALEDQIQGFTGSGKYDTDKWTGTFQNPNHLYEPMDRATGEMQYPRQMSLKVFTKFVQVGTQQIAVAVTQEQVQDLQKQWGIDVLKLVENAAINELSQSINKHILSRLFALGWKNHNQAYDAEGINLNIDLSGAASTDPVTSVTFASYDETGEVQLSMTVPHATVYGTFENADTMYKKIGVSMIAAGNVIMQRGRRGAANFVVTNWKVATMLQTNAQYAFSPIANTFNQTNGSLYPVGTIGGLTVYVDPLMHTQDTRVLVGRKGDKDEPGVVFCPYIMAEKIQLIAEGTGAPKVLLKSRYALVDVGWYPQLNYLTFYVKTPEGLI